MYVISTTDGQKILKTEDNILYNYYSETNSGQILPKSIPFDRIYYKNETDLQIIYDENKNPVQYEITNPYAILYNGSNWRAIPLTEEGEKLYYDIVAIDGVAIYLNNVSKLSPLSIRVR